MKRTIVSAMMMLAFFGLGLMIGGLKSQSVSSTVAIAAPAPAPMAVPMPNRCPRIHEAVGAIDRALDDLNSAGHNFCGHKVAAMNTLRAARRDLHEAEECDRCR